MTIEQDRARLAHEHVTGIGQQEEDGRPRKAYATVVHELTTLVRSSGVVQALEFVGAYTNPDKKKAGEKLLEHLAVQMRRVVPSVKDGQGLRELARRTGDLRVYMHLGRELLATLVWYRRCIQSILKIDPTETATQDED